MWLKFLLFATKSIMSSDKRFGSILEILNLSIPSTLSSSFISSSKVSPLLFPKSPIFTPVRTIFAPVLAAKKACSTVFEIEAERDLPLARGIVQMQK